MIATERPTTPIFLTEVRSREPFKGESNEEAWGKQYLAKLKKPAHRNNFTWASYCKTKVNVLLEPELRLMTKNHCAFCDIFPLQQSGGTIEHFKPSSKYPLDSHRWSNLFYCCNACQSKKRNDYDSLLLKPDEIGYAFDDFFLGRTEGLSIFLIPNPAESSENQNRAEITIKLYGLNAFGRPEGRYIEYLKFKDSRNPNIDDFPYRFLFT